MSPRLACSVQHCLLRVFPRAARNIKLPMWVWRRLCASECSTECSTTCRGCRKLAAEREREASAQAHALVGGAPERNGAAAPTFMSVGDPDPEVAVPEAAAPDAQRVNGGERRRKGCGC